MGLFGGSSKKSSTSTNQTDRRQVIGERSTSSGFDNVKVGSRGSLTTQTVNNVIDGGAWDLVDGVVRNTVSALGDSNSRALSFADGAMSNALGMAYDSTGRALGFADGAMSQAMDLANASTAGALSRALGIAYDSTGRSLNFADGAMSNALGVAYDSTGRALNFADGAFSQVLGVVNDAMNTVRGGLTTAADAAAASAGMAKDAYADAKGRGAMTDYLLLAAVVVMGIVAVRARG